MKAVFLDAPGRIAVREVAAPTGRLHDHAAMLRVTGASICGSDLPPYRHMMPNFRYGTIPGHEFAGVVVEVGRRVQRVGVGMRAFASDLIACGDCSSCRRGWHYHCPSMALFGTGGTVGAYVPGGQAEFVRVPFADTVLAPIPEGVSDAAAILVGDVLSTAFMGLQRARLTAGADLAVIGTGPVGLAAILCAHAMGASTVVAVDSHPVRREAARRLGATAMSPDEFSGSGRAGRRGFSHVIEAVGSEATLRLAVGCASPRAAIGVVGVPHGDLAFPALGAFLCEATVGFTVGDPILVRDELLGMIVEGRLCPEQIVSHTAEMEDAADLYRRFAAGDIVKVIMKP